jgi:ribonuclease HI
VTNVPPLVAVFADESCLGNGREGENPGGAGVLVEYVTTRGTLVRRDLWVAERATTNNRMALRSVIEALRAIGGKKRHFRVVFTTDSRYIVDGMTQWVHDWAKRGWRRKTGEIENLALWQEAVAAAAPHQVAWQWIRGHAGHAQNEYANDLAVRAAGELHTSNGLVPSQFDEWLKARAESKKAVTLVDFPHQATFRPSRPLPASRATSPSPAGIPGLDREPT